MKAFVLAIDIGTSGTKALLFDRQGQAHASAYRAYPTQFVGDGAEQDPDEILAAVRDCLQQLLTPSSINQVAAVGFSAAMHSLLGTDHLGRPRTPLYTWGDLRARHQAAALRATPVAARLHQQTGTPVHPMSPLCKLVWLRQEAPQLFRDTARWMGIKEYVWLHLTGTHWIDHSLASATGLFDLRARTWNKEALTLAGVQPEQLSMPVSVHAQHNAVREIPTHIPLVIGASDGCLAHLGSDLLTNDDLSLTIGTSAAVRRLSAAQTDPHGRLFTYWLDDTRCITGGASNNGFSVFQWWHRQTGSATDAAAVERALVNTAPGGGGLQFIPYVLGERAPYYDPDLRPSFHHRTEKHQQDDLLRAMAEGIACNLQLIINAIEETSGPWRRLVASGGFVHSPAWVQLMADLTGHPVDVRDFSDASARGAAVMTWHALGHTVPLQSAPAATYLPRPEFHAQYRKVMAEFMALLPRRS